jgi:hypothetical protein
MKFTAQINAQGKIVPLYDSDYAKFKRVPKDKEVSIEIKQPRNAKFHRKFFALINMVFENQDIYTDLDQLRYDLTIEAGFYEQHKDFNGDIKTTAKSISFAKMDDIEFSKLYSQFVDTVIRILKWDSEMIEENIESYL